MSKITDIFYKNVQKSPNKPAIFCDGDKITYKELEILVNKWTNLMIKNGVRYGDNVGILLPNNILFVAFMLVASKIGIAITPLSPTLPSEAVDLAFKSSEVKHIIGIQSTLEGINLNKYKIKLSLYGNVKDCINFDDIINNYGDENNIDYKITGNEALILTMTSGSTGQPKPIILTQNNKFDRAFSAIKLYGVTDKDIVLAATPLYHSLAERLVLIPLLLGGTSVLMPRFSPSTWLKTVKDLSVTFTIAVSSQLRQIAEVLKSPFLPEINSLRCIVSSSALLESHTKKELIDKLNCDFHECYGTSEIAIATNLNIIGSKNKLKSVGCSIDGVDVKILKENKTFAKTGEAGEIVCRTPMIFGGYYKLPELTKNAMFGKYFCTGDIGKMDEEGFLYFLDRKKDLIISGGINIYPSDIEEVILKLDDIAEVAAFPYPDKNLGEVIAVACVLKNKDKFNLRNLKFHCAKYLADFQQPRQYFIVDELPKNNMGKLIKHKLVEMFEG